MNAEAEEVRRCFNIVVNKLLEKCPELSGWIELNFGDLLDEDNL